MSTGPARLSRRSLLRGAASVTVVAALAAVSSCADGPRAPDADADGPDDGSPLLRLGILTIGPIGLIAGSYALTLSNSVSENRAAAAFTVFVPWNSMV